MDEAMTGGLNETVGRLDAAVSLLESAVARLEERSAAVAASAEESVGRIVATVESAREAELERKLAAAEARIAELTASAAASTTPSSGGRKTLSAGMTAMLSKQGVAGLAAEGLEAGAIDAALQSLSIEQRIAVKSELMRAGLLFPTHQR